MIILAWAKSSIFLGDKKNGTACDDLEEIIQPVLRCSSMKVLQASFLAGLSGYTLVILGMNVSLRSMVWSNGRWGGSCS